MTLPDGPRLPALVQTLSVITQPISFLERCASRYGDTFTLRVLGIDSPPVIFISCPETIQAVFTYQCDDFELGKVTHVFRPLVGEWSLIMQKQYQHQRQRQLLMPALHREQLERHGNLICRLTALQIANWQVTDVIDPRSQLSEISLQVILQVVFGLNGGERYDRLRQLLTQLLEAITSPLYSIQFFWPLLQQNLGDWSPWGSFLQQRQQIDTLIYAEITERRSQDLSERSDVLSVLMAACDEQGNPMSDLELRDQLMTLLLLGHETTASALTWAFYWLHQNPDSLKRLRQELKDISDPAALSQLPYLSAVCKESLRVYPIALITQPRKVRVPVQLEGYDLTPGTVVIPCIYLAQRRRETYADPSQFRPERFIDRKFSPYEFFPFGGGSRLCVGMALSMLEMKLILATVIARCEFTTRSQQAVRPARRGITFVPPKDFRLTVNAIAL